MRTEPNSAQRSTVPLQEIADVIDSLHATPVYSETGPAMVRVTDVKDGFLSLSNCVRVSRDVFEQFTRNHAPVEGDIVVSRVGTYGVFSYVGTREPFCLRQNTAVIHPREDHRYLYYALRSPQTRLHIEGRVVGSTQKTLSLRHIRELPIPYPPANEREGIGQVLGSLDDKIEQNRRTGRALEGLARATFKAWFVDFEPVKAKAVGQTSFPGLPPAAFAALPNRLTDSPSGPVPEGWAVRPLQQAVKLTMGQSPSSEFYNLTGEGLPFHQGVSDHGFRFPARRVYCTVEGRMADAGDVLLSVRAPVGRINVADVRMVLGRGLAGMRHKQGYQSFLLYLMQHHFAEDDAVGEGTIYKSVNKEFVEAMPLITPPVEALRAFENNAAPIDAMISSLTKESSQLASLRDYLLPRLLSGRVRVRDAESQL